jgi:hypothetical protein
MNEIAINPAHFALITGFLNALGASIKAIPSLENHWIPFILAGAGGIGHGVLAGWTGQNILIGVVAAMTAVGGHQVAQMAGNVVKPK